MNIEEYQTRSGRNAPVFAAGLALLAGCADNALDTAMVRERTQCTAAISSIINRDSRIPVGMGGGKNRTSIHRPEVINVGKDETWLGFTLAPSCEPWIRSHLSLHPEGFQIPAQITVAGNRPIFTSLDIGASTNTDGFWANIGPVDLSLRDGMTPNLSGDQDAAIQFPTTDIPSLRTQFEYDLIAPVISNLTARVNGRHLTLVFNTSEPGVWSVVVGNSLVTNVFQPTETRPCSTLVSTIDGYNLSPCSQGWFCTLQHGRNLDICTPRVLGGSVTTAGIQERSVVVDDLPAGDYSATLLFIDRGDNAADIRTVPFTINR